MNADSSSRTPRGSERRQLKKIPYFADEARERDRVQNLRKRTRRTTPPRAPRYGRSQRSRSRSRSADRSRDRLRRQRSRSYDRRRSRSGSYKKVTSSSSFSRRRRSRSRSRSRTPRIITVPVPVPAADYNYAYGWSHPHPPRQHYDPMYPPMLPFGMNPRPPRPYFAPYPQFPPFRYRSGAFGARPRFNYVRNVRHQPN
ncbi:female-specific protein transformer [Drosophila sulfurigaster albostrigata]|uniref:female-specific protein transformer n=1 Tax=Drosophila sulfurigaster albostrigata TaxID=89887 RepID=UPI002D21A749|nr:female-specific protein transformer [Drosophila sulfurigaster albostrigata]